MRYFQPVLLAIVGAALAISSTRCSLASQSATVANKKSAPNAYDFYLRAAKEVEVAPTDDWPNLDNSNQKGAFKSNLERQSFWLNKNRQALTTLRQGFNYAYTPPARNSSADVLIGVRMTLFSQMMKLTEVLSLESRVYRARREYSMSANSSIDAIRLGNDLSRGALVDVVVGFSIQDAGWVDLAPTIRLLDATSAKAAAKRLESLDERALPYNLVLQREKSQGQMLLREIFSGNNWRKDYETTKSQREIEATYNSLMDNAIANAKKPYPLRRKSFEMPNDAVNQQLFSVFYSDEPNKPSAAATGTPHERVQAVNRLFATQLALQAFKRQHNFYPSNLRELVPNYLKKVPQDPFSNKKPLLYNRRDDEYSLYSAGPDNKDDKGKPMLPNDVVKTTSRGDIVAGINR